MTEFYPHTFTAGVATARKKNTMATTTAKETGIKKLRPDIIVFELFILYLSSFVWLDKMCLLEATFVLSHY